MHPFTRPSLTCPAFRSMILRRIAPAICTLAVLLVFSCLLLSRQNDEQRFQQITKDLFRSEMTANTLNMHYTLAFPEHFGIKEYQAVLPGYVSGKNLVSLSLTENLLARLYALDTSEFGNSTRYTHALLTTTLENSLALGAFPYYDEPLSPSSGMQSQLPILLAEYTFRCKRDVEDYLRMLDQSDEYFESLLIYERQKAQAGLLMPSISLKKVIEQCDEILNEEELESGTHFLQTTFMERLEGLVADGIITSDEAADYHAQNNRLLRTVMQPAYEALGDGLLVLEDPSIPVEGLASKPDGRAYYELLLISQTGSYRSVETIRQMILEQLSREYTSLKTLLTTYPQLLTLTDTLLSEDTFPYKNASRMLTDLQQRMADDFPPLDTDGSLPSVAIKPVSASLQDYCAPAFYLTPPLDDTSSNAIYINEKSTPGGLELYTTLAHEGYPGHMYQSVYHNRSMMISSEDISATVRELLWYGGYLEGWALYVEFLSYDYARELYAEQEDSTPLQLAAVELTMHDRNLLLSIYSLLDIMIHYDNASIDTVSQFLGQFGITHENTIASVYEYIVEEPTNYLKYYLGYLEILELKEQAKKLWGETYSDYRFHTFYLEQGPADFRMLEKRLESEK